MTRRLAVLAGAGAGLISLWNDVPVDIAAMRGAGAFFALLLVARLGLMAIGVAGEGAARSEVRTQGGAQSPGDEA